jgi:hypothetical protein
MYFSWVLESCRQRCARAVAETLKLRLQAWRQAAGMDAPNRFSMYCSTSA